MYKQNQIVSIIRNAIDVHVHIGPEIIPRKFTVQELTNAEKGNIAGFVLKNHFYSTIPFIKESKNKKGLKLYGSITLNNAVGGMNADAVYTASYLNDNPFFVWFPTINAENFLIKSVYEIAPEWVKNSNVKARTSQRVKPVKIVNKIGLTQHTIEVLKAIKKCKAILATGHISAKETVIVVDKALDIGIKKIIVTHPIYQRIDMPINTQIYLAKKGCYIEQCYSMYSIDKISIQAIAQQIKVIGPQSTILSSDVGQTFSPKPSRALYKFALLLLRERIMPSQLYTMMATNPKNLLSV